MWLVLLSLPHSPPVTSFLRASFAAAFSWPSLAVFFFFFSRLHACFPAGPHDAANQGNLPALTRLLTRNPQLARAKDSDGWTPLHLAACGGHLAAMRFLVEEHRADTAAKDSDVGTPLAYARRYNRAAVAAYLEQRGAPE
jgi:hypothetical protein